MSINNGIYMDIDNDVDLSIDNDIDNSVFLLPHVLLLLLKSCFLLDGHFRLLVVFAVGKLAIGVIGSCSFHAGQ